MHRRPSSRRRVNAAQAVEGCSRSLCRSHCVWRVAARESAGRWPSPPLEWAIAAVRLTGSKIPRVSTIYDPSLALSGCPCMVPFGFFLWRHGRGLHNCRRRLRQRKGSHPTRSWGGSKRRLGVLDNRLGRGIICRGSMTLDARRRNQRMETDRKYCVHAQTDRDDCCCRPEIMAPRDGQTQEDTSQIRYNGGRLLSRAHGHIGSIGRSRHASKKGDPARPIGSLTIWPYSRSTGAWSAPPAGAP
jgi:hypothetical protein